LFLFTYKKRERGLREGLEREKLGIPINIKRDFGGGGSMILVLFAIIRARNILSKGKKKERRGGYL
jgi:hypothetical protein